MSTESMILIWIFSAVLGGAIGLAKNRVALGIILGALLSLLGVLIIACLPKKKVSSLPSGISNEEIADLAALVKDRGKVGITLSPKDGRTVVAVSVDGSAAAAGIRVGDRLLAIDEVLCEGSYKSIMLKIAGERGSFVHLKMRREGNILDVKLERK